MMKKLLFISWDADTSNYLESLFFPIFDGIQQQAHFQIHILQFSWADKEEVMRIQNIASSKNLIFNHHKITKGKFQKLAVLYAVYKGVFAIKNYIENHDIQIIMPRSTMPAMMCNRLSDWIKRKKIKIIFDADGLPLEERIDFAGLKSTDLQYRLLKKEETKLLHHADHVLVRTLKAKEIHLQNLNAQKETKFSVVTNGRDPSFFNFKTENKNQIRAKLGLNEDTKLFFYSGTIGPQYALDEMIAIFEAYWKTNKNTSFILLTRRPELVENHIPEDLKAVIYPIATDFDQIPKYLAAADLAFSLRLPAPSLAGIAPIKLGEYLLMGIPTMASAAVGDTESMLKSSDFCHIYQHNDPERIPKAMNWINQLKSNREEIIHFGQENFSLNLSITQYLKVLNAQSLTS
ncbi:hypothetical protein [Belliella aquatica]|uniref:Uncharacterized protein n=1 Tax=Belliella aquatica TaxID=1323734 RepID=A0ABQ1LXP7_9BACT|nr:hypothetical protein [Belliella aquatica]MCH7407327.1 hypothetical protein [Belliella aquatica]GGC31761.1 hypothetical protein GCM10010993_08410 [Belliella aquatica]